MRCFGKPWLTHKVLWCACLVCLFCFSATDAYAHDARPIVVDVVQAEDLSVNISVKVPDSLDSRYQPTVKLSENCIVLSDPILSMIRQSFIQERAWQCAALLSGSVIEIDFPLINPSLTTLFQISLANGVVLNKVLPPGEQQWLIPEEPSFLQIAIDYTQLGFTHILRGIDHLLFIVCLLFLAGTQWRIITAITGFTLAHSLTLALSVLGYVRLSVVAVEALIALSILFLVIEVLKNNRQSLAWRYPIVVASVFGLLHGLGFASVLAEIGLPQLGRAQALFFFNLGVEIGQVAFIIAVIFIRFLFTKNPIAQRQFSSHSFSKVLGLYAIGIVSTYWFVERSMQVVV